MLLTIDIGNTNTVLGVFDGDRVTEHCAVGATRDERDV
jgi:pantothenate kinase type III